MMDQLVKFAMEHQAAMLLVGGVLAGAIGWVVPTPKQLKIGFTISQYVRRILGAKVEERLEETLDGIVKGMKSDNKKG